MYNEYQVHYWFLNGRFTFHDGSILDIAIPTVYFNYKQEVSASSVDFHLKDVNDISDALKDVRNIKVNELLNSPFAEAVERVFPDTAFEWFNVNLGTIHRHPGSLSTFSSTDLSTTFPNPGICFPLAEIEDDFDKPSFSSILLHENGETVIGRTEYRLADRNTENTVTYRKGRGASIVHGEMTAPSAIEQLIGIQSEDTSYTTADDLPSLGILSTIEQLFKELDYEASTQFIKQDNITSKAAYKAPCYSRYTAPKDVRTVPHVTSASYRETAASIKDEYKITLYTKQQLQSMSKAAKNKQLDELKEACFSTTLSAYTTTLSINSIVKEILDLQDELWLQESMYNTHTTVTTPTKKKIGRNTKIEELVDWGLSEMELRSYTDDELDSMYSIMCDCIADC
jgi:hypothetical protein